MKFLSSISAILLISFTCVYAQNQLPGVIASQNQPASTVTTKNTSANPQAADAVLTTNPVSVEPNTHAVKPAIILLINEQNIEGPQHAWWASEVDLSTTEAKVAQKLLAQGYNILDPSQLNSRIAQKPAFRVLSISEQDSITLGNLAKADYVVLGKAVASSGPNVPNSNMRSCFANITVKVIRVKDGKVISFLDASGNSAHLDVITGGKEALARAADNIANQLNTALSKEGGI